MKLKSVFFGCYIFKIIIIIIIGRENLMMAVLNITNLFLDSLKESAS